MNSELPSDFPYAADHAPRGAHPRRKGRLTVYFGMGPGSGKTSAILRAALSEHENGADVQIGVVETRARPGTEALAGQLAEALGGVSLPGELDLPGVLARHPALLLVDDLGHDNAPEARHPKRYQDVIELLAAGIGVAATIDVCALESRAEAAARITGRPVSETVPDSVMDEADEIVLVDVTPSEFIDRRDETRSLLGGRADVLPEAGLGERQLTALRELALRFMAERMDRRLRELKAAEPGQPDWRSTERLLVAVGPSPSSVRLVRWARRMAAAQGAPWMAVSVESPRLLTPRARRSLDGNLALARELGAEIVVTQDENLANALIRTAREHRATQIFVGRSRAPKWIDRLNGGSTVDRLIRLGGEFDIRVAPAGGAGDDGQDGGDFDRAHLSPIREYLLALNMLAVVSLAGVFAVGHVGLHAVGLGYLMCIVVLSLVVGRGPVLMAGVVSALAWDFLFIPPVLSFHIGKPEDAAMFAAYFVVALVTGELTARIRNKEQNERSRELRATALYRLTLSLADAAGPDEAVAQALAQCGDLFAARCALLLSDEKTGKLTQHPSGTLNLGEQPMKVAEWSIRNRKPAGRFTGTFGSAAGFFTPLVRGTTALGVLCIEVQPDSELALSQRDLVEGIAAQLAMFVERDRLRAAAEREKLLSESERLHRVLLDGVSHELKTPLAVLSAAADRIDDADAATRASLAGEIRIATHRLNRLVNNLLDQTRLESGALRPRIDWCDAGDLIFAAVDSVRESLAGRPFETSVDPDMPLFRADFALMEQVIANLLLNAALHTPPGTAISLAAGWDRPGGRVCFTVADRGPGLPLEMRDRLFKKFQRGDSARAGGLGLGLSIVRGFVTAQGGEIVAGENPGGGAAFTVYLPCPESGRLTT